eukprot:1010166-Prymnesium_polylepis.1
MPDNARQLTFSDMRQMPDNARQSADSPTKRPTLRQFRQTGLCPALTSDIPKDDGRRPSHGQ